VNGGGNLSGTILGSGCLTFMSSPLTRCGVVRTRSLSRATLVNVSESVGMRRGYEGPVDESPDGNGRGRH